jgi:hypothetical protein
MCHETVLEQTEQEAKVKCTDDTKTESTAYSQTKTRTVETAKSSKITAETRTDVCYAATAKGRKAGHRRTHSGARTPANTSEKSDGTERLSENLPQSYTPMEILGYLD